jgi:F0F1-type ATP synthase assembly protein I
MVIWESILAPGFLVNNIDVIAFIIAVMMLVLFDDFVTGKIIFPLADFIKYKFAKEITNLYEKKGIKSAWAKSARRYFSEAFATVLVIVYCYLGYAFLGVYFIEPILQRWSAVILLVVIVLFLMLNYLVNNTRMRRRFFGFGAYKPEEKA